MVKLNHRVKYRAGINVFEPRESFQGAIALQSTRGLLWWEKVRMWSFCVKFEPVITNREGDTRKLMCSRTFHITVVFHTPCISITILPPVWS